MDSAELNAKSEPKTIRRIEVLSGPERRRQWSADDKERIVSESYSGVDKVSRIARRHGLSPQQLFTWRREARQASLSPAFAAVALAPQEAPPPVAQPTTLPGTSTIARSSRRKKIGSRVTSGLFGPSVCDTRKLVAGRPVSSYSWRRYCSHCTLPTP